MPTEISPWLESLQRHKTAIGIGAAIVVLAVSLAWVAWRWDIAEDRLELLDRKAEQGFLVPPSSNRRVRIDPRAPRVVTVGGEAFPERVDFYFNARTPRHSRFRMSLLREDGTLLLHADQMVRDSNYDLRLSFNSSLLAPGSYLLRVEGYARGGRLERFAEARILASGG
jgi:hypothetical protein